MLRLDTIPDLVTIAPKRHPARRVAAPSGVVEAEEDLTRPPPLELDRDCLQAPRDVAVVEGDLASVPILQTNVGCRTYPTLQAGHR